MQQNYLIVGGTSGIGLELVKRLSADGHSVTVISRKNENLDGLSNVTHLAKDVTSAVFEPNDLPSPLHGLAYCPGTINLNAFRSLKPEVFQKDLDVNLLGAVRILQAAERPLKKAGSASVVLFSTVAVGQGMPFHASIAAAKGAVEGLALSLAAEWSPKVRVNCIAPSLTDTPLANHLLSSPEKRESGDKRHPLRRVGTPEDIANMAEFLLSAKGSWITGQIIGVDGGMANVRV